MIEIHVIALHSDVGVDVKSDRIELFDSFSLVKREFVSEKTVRTRPCARVNLCPGGFSCCIKLDG